MPNMKVGHRSQAVREIAKSFDYDHLPDHLRGFSQQFYDLAANMVNDLPADSVQLTNGLQKLLEAKDCFVRAAQAKHEGGGI